MKAQRDQEARPCVVVVDDSFVVLDRVRHVLSGAGYDVRATNEPRSAGPLLRGADLVIVDFHMPGIEGGEILPVLKKSLLAADNLCAFYPYTSDADVAKHYQKFGYNGGFLRKGDEAALLVQVEAALRTVRTRKLALALRERRRKSDAD